MVELVWIVDLEVSFAHVEVVAWIDVMWHHNLASNKPLSR